MNPPKDYSEFREQGGTVEEFLAHALSAQRYVPPATTAQPTTGASAVDGLMRACDMREPGPRPFLFADLIPCGCVTSLYGDGGTGKTLVAILLAILVATGRPFAGRSTRQMPVLFLDGEMDFDEFLRRTYRLSRGLGMEYPPDDLYYYRLPGPLLDTTVQMLVRGAVGKSGAGFVVLDSLTMASYSTDTSEAAAAIQAIKFLETLGTVLVIDHMPKAQPGSNLSHATQFGSAFKRYAVRAQWQLVRADGGGLALLHKKSNFGPYLPPITLALDFTADAIRLEALAVGDERLAGLEQNLPALERTLHALAEFGEEGAPVDQLAASLGIAVQTVRNHLTALKNSGRVERMGASWWRVPLGAHD